ncbi:MAG: hypothetical protein ACFFA3_16960 [Promethearchaeota archaeon]
MPALAHLGIGFATKRFAPQIPLWILLISSMALDLLSGVFFFALWINHGLFMSVVWTIIFMLITMLITYHLKSKKENNISFFNIETWTISTIVGFVVFSHFILDFIGWPMSVLDSNATGVPLLFNDNINIGLGVYSTWVGALSMDLGVFTVGLVIYIHYKLKK